MAEISFKIDGADEVITALNDLGDFLEKPKTMLKEVGEHLATDLKQNIFSSNQKRRFGGSWPPLSAKTVKARLNGSGYYGRVGGSGVKPLLWSGRLLEGFGIVKLRQDHVVVSNTVEYWKYHQGGKGRPPKRESLGLTSIMIQDVMQIFNTHLDRIIDG